MNEQVKTCFNGQVNPKNGFTAIENYLFDNNTLMHFHYRWLLEKVYNIQQLYKYNRPDLQTGKLNAWGEAIQEIEKTVQTALRQQQEIADRLGKSPTNEETEQLMQKIASVSERVEIVNTGDLTAQSISQEEIDKYDVPHVEAERQWEGMDEDFMGLNQGEEHPSFGGEKSRVTLEDKK